MEFLGIIEIAATLLSLGFLLLLIKENRWCWLFGIISSTLSIYLFYQTKLYAESFLYIFYVLIGFYGWYVWNRNDTKEFKIHRWSIKQHIPLFIFGLGITGLVYYLFSFFEDGTDREIDSFTTSFSFVASFLEAHKIFGTWVYWIIVNATTALLYYRNGLSIYAALMLIYFIFSIYGYFNWRNKLRVQV